MIQLKKFSGLSSQWLLNFSYERGITQAEIEQSLDLEKDSNGGYEFLSMEDYIRLINWTAKRLDESLLGLQLSKVVKGSDFGSGMLTVYHAATLRDVCLCLSRYDQTISKAIVIDFIEGKNESRLEYRVNIAPAFDISQEVELAMALLMKLLRKQLDDAWSPLEVGFSHKPNSSIEDYYEFIGKNVKFEQAVNYCAISSSDLNLEATPADPNMLKVLRENADQLLDKILKIDDIVGQVKFYIARTLGTDACSANHAATQFFMSRRNLTRQLMTRGTSFR
ncbi:AraC family transcriptional regulator ligand-binding domain-containing protein, partial [Oleiphilus sp. HI0117]